MLESINILSLVKSFFPQTFLKRFEGAAAQSDKEENHILDVGEEENFRIERNQTRAFKLGCCIYRFILS